MPFGNTVTILNGFITDSNGNQLIRVTDVNEIEPIKTDDYEQTSAIDTTRIFEPIVFTFKPLAYGKFKKFYAALYGWKAKGPFRKRTLNRLIFGGK